MATLFAATPAIAWHTSVAHADTAPLPPAAASTVSSDPLPTVQINGVVWDQLVVANTVYVTGEFTSARPAGSPPGTSETPKANILAYDLTTGNLIPAFTASLNAAGRSLAVSADGKRIFVAGSFTQVNGVNRYRIAALDAASGAVITSWSPGANARVSVLAVSGDTVYLGGIFSSVSNLARNRLAAVSATTGTVLGWAPAADAEVLAMTAPPGSGKVVVGGKFFTLNAAAAYGMGALDATTGVLLPWAITNTVRNAGSASAIYSLKSDANQVYGTGYTFGGGGNFEGTFAAHVSDGAIEFVTSCRGDTYDTAPVGGTLYVVGHAHNCEPIDGIPQTNPWLYVRAQAETTTRAPSGLVNADGEFMGLPAPELLHWMPTLGVGSYTHQDQAAWTVEGNGQYVVLGGEFPSVNGVPQQGLVRFATRAAAPNHDGPQGGVDLRPTVTGFGPGTVRVSWLSAWDRDNRHLTYQVLRGETAATAQVVGTATRESTWWNRAGTSVEDTTAPPGSTQTYRVRVRDDLGNVVTSDPATGKVPTGTPAVARYQDAVRADGALYHWRLGDAAGSTSAADWAGTTPLTLGWGTTLGTPGAIGGETNTAVTFGGFNLAPAVMSGPAIPAPQHYTVEAWIRTTTTTGGKIIGFGDSPCCASGTADRHVYMLNSGAIAFGSRVGTTMVTATSPKSYNDGRWHHVAASIGTAGMKLYVDGAMVAGNTSMHTSSGGYTGWWHVGGDGFGGWPNAPASWALAGSIDEAAVYPSELSADQIARHVAAAAGATANQPPTASFTATTAGLTVNADATASADPDGSIASYGWDFGDGGRATTAKASHTYAAAGTYTVKLTVTDDRGGTGGSASTVVVAASLPGQTLAADAFGRELTSGWGTADTGGAWTLSASGSTLGVTGGAGQMSVPAGRTATARLAAVSSTSTDLVVSIGTGAALTGGGAYVSPIVRSVSATSDYRIKLRLQPTGQVSGAVDRVDAGTESALTTGVTLPGVTVTTGSVLLVRAEATGTSPTTIRFRAWLQGTPEPATWAQTVTDGTASLQAAGGVGIVTYVSASATAPVLLTVDDLRAVTG